MTTWCSWKSTLVWDPPSLRVFKQDLDGMGSVWQIDADAWKTNVPVVIEIEGEKRAAESGER